MGLQITITNSGLAALVNVQNTGTAARQITHIGVTATTFTPTSSMTSLPGEIKRLTTFGGQVVAGDTFHVSLRDDSADVYTMRGFALYLDDGTMLAVYGQPTPIMEKAAASMVLLAGDIKLTQVSATTLSFGSTNWINPPATTEVLGVIEIATPAEANAGVDTQRAVTPEGMKYTLDQRFGANSPSNYIKTSVLGVATAAALKVALAIKSAANFDTGAGNGLDADLLDGQHGAYYQAWSNLTGVPATFTPSAHNHAWGNITGAPETATRWPTWSEVSGKPGTFTPAAHSHDAADIVGGVLAVARIPALSFAQTPGLTEAINGRAPSSHTHDGNDVTGRLGRVANLTADWNFALDNGYWMGVDAVNSPGGGWWLGEVVVHNTNFVTQTVWQFAGDYRLTYRRQKSGGSWGGWERVRIFEIDQDARYLKNTGGQMSGDLTVYRQGDPSKGFIFLGNTGTQYIACDGTNYFVGGASGGTIWHSGSFNPATKANTHNPVFSGGVGIGISTVTAGALDVSTGSGRLIARTSRGMAGIDSVTEGNSAYGPINFEVTAAYVAGYEIHHAGNFNPAAKANLSGAAFAGEISAPSVKVGSSSVWHEGSFNPDSKANLTGAAFTGEVAAPSYNTTSDRTRKKAIAPLTNCLATVMQVLPREFEWRSTGNWDTGYIAQELQEVLPHAVCELHNEDGEDPLLGIRLDKLSPYLVGAVQELMAIIERQDARIKKLEAM